MRRGVIMQVTMATAVAGRPGRVNEDFTGATPDAAVLVDGAGIIGIESICRHGVAWYATRLGGTLLGLLALAPGRSLTALLAEAIERVTDSHRDTCDVTERSSPSATVAMIRVADGRLEHLVLGDSTVVLDRAGAEPIVVNDPREVDFARPYKSVPEAGREAFIEMLRSRRNQPGGFWVAKDDPRAADEAITGSCPAGTLNGAVLLSNGATRIVDTFHLADWPEVLTMLAESGPGEVIRRVRAAEVAGDVSPDDATITRCRF
jgi:Protein phosphatase 2C